MSKGSVVAGLGRWRVHQ